MSAQVDVLAVLDAEIASLDWEEMRKARDAVAALIAERDALREALKSLRGVVPYFWHDDSPHIGELDEACEAADNALARAQGVQS